MIFRCYLDKLKNFTNKGRQAGEENNMVKIIYEDWSKPPEKSIYEIVTHHITIKAAENDFIKKNWGKSYKIVSLKLINKF